MTFDLAVVTYEVNGEAFEGYQAAAQGDSKGSVSVIHDWDGLTDYEKMRTDMLAKMGYDAFAAPADQGGCEAFSGLYPLPRVHRLAESVAERFPELDLLAPC